jgi:hypothetical protein
METRQQHAAAPRRATAARRSALLRGLLAASALLLLSGCANERLLGVNYVPDKLQHDRDPVDKIKYFAISRILDAIDVFTANVGIGPAAHAEIHFTQACRFGVGGAYLASFGTGEAPREFGMFGRSIGEFSFGPAQMGSVEYDPYLSTGENYGESYADIRRPSELLYRKKRDYWSFGFSGGLAIFGFQFEFHPLQALDFFAGWFGKDPLQDDK